MKKFNEWFSNHLAVRKWPSYDYVKKFDYVINVSDEHQKIVQTLSTRYFWFPMSECSKDMGMSSIYGALTILYEAYESNSNVLLHCHAGVNRSVTIAQLFYFMMTGMHVEETIDDSNESDAEDSFKFLDLFTEEPSTWTKRTLQRLLQKNKLLNNIEAGHLPARLLIERFVNNLRQQLDDRIRVSLDELLLESKIR